jgi:hypothetical protein
MSDESAEYEPETMPWEDEATGAVDHALDSATFDEVQGTIIIPDSTGDRRMVHHCASIEELRETLEGLYDEQWYANVPFDGGEALDEGDASGYVGEVLDRDEIKNFYAQFGEEPEGEQLVNIADLLKQGATEIIRLDVQDINDELISHLAAHPEKMREMPSRKFEELVAELFRAKGYEVELTPRSRDGGFDVRAVHRTEVGTVLIIIECKRYAAENKVGVEIVRGLYGVVEQKRATKGLIATTSYFSSDATKFHNDVQYRLALADFDALRAMLQEWKTKNT